MTEGRSTPDGLQQALVEQARVHDADAWEALYRAAYPRLHAYARRRLHSAAEADDAVSETMSRALAGIASYRWTGAGFDAWLFGILRNVVAEHHRRRLREVPVDTGLDAAAPEGPGDPGRAVVDDEERKFLRAAFDRLAPADREVLELRVIAELDAAAVGEVLGKRAGTVRTAQSRALQRLRVIMREQSS